MRLNLALFQPGTLASFAVFNFICYKKSAELAKQALRENRRIKDLVREQKLLDDALLDRLLDPFAMTEPSKV